MCMCFQHFGDKSIPILPQAFPDADKGIPSQSDILSRYCSTRGEIVPQDFHMYLALSFFRLASIVQGVVARFHQGNSARITDPQVAEAMSQAVEILSSKGLELAMQQQQTAIAVIELPDFLNSSCFGEISAPAATCLRKLHVFIENHARAGEREWLSHVAPTAQHRWQPVPVIERLKQNAKELGLWNLWLPPDLQQNVKEMGELCTGLSNREYCLAARMMGAFPWLSEVFNCSAPDTGNMELLLRFGNTQQHQQYLLPLLKGETRSCFAMTEPNTASSNPTQISTTITDVENGIMVHGRKWWISGACDPRCSFALVFGLHRDGAAAHKRHSIVIVPMNAAGVTVVRPLTVFGYDDAPHGHAEVTFSNVIVPSSNLVFEAGAGFLMGQARLGPGRLHHCIRAIGCTDRAIDLYVSRSLSRRISHSATLISKQTVQHTLAECIMSRDTAFASCMLAAHELDVHGNASKRARHALAVAKVVSPR
jgi:alkylation response protein AidB-like acyl-CoA dehydrogenase